MTEETKRELMQYVHKMAIHYEIPNSELVTFKKRNVLLELLNSKNKEAFEIISDLINSALTVERIQNDKEKQSKKPEHWQLEVETAQGMHQRKLEEIKLFFNKVGIL